jgi:CelD/BcsL family acetyltransferase involved in cellulose biosynthesis
LSETTLLFIGQYQAPESEPTQLQTKLLQTTRVLRISDLDAYRDAWHNLADGAPMRSPEWLLSWWRYYAAPEDELCVLLFHDQQGSLAGLAPLYLEVRNKRRTVRFLGSGEASTNHTTWLAAVGWETQVSHAVAQFLLDLAPAWHCLLLESVDADNSAINATVRHLRENGCLVRRTARHNCWEIALPPTWQDYLKTLSKIHRKRCLKWQRQVLDPGHVQVHRITNETELEKGFAVLLQLHAARWGDPATPLGCFSDRRFREFHQTVARELLERNQLQLVWLEYDGRPVAAEYQFTGNKKIYSYQAGMDPSVTEFPPGNISIMNSIHFAIAHGFESFDFSRGDQPYKANWRAVPLACHDVGIWHNNISGRWEYAKSGLRDLAERKRMTAVKWVKARISPHWIDAWRHMLYSVSGKRRGPKKAGL